MLKFSKCTLAMKALAKCIETLQRDRGMPKDTGELIFKKSINLYCQPIFSYISSFVIAPYAPFSQSQSHIIIVKFRVSYVTRYWKIDHLQDF